MTKKNKILWAYQHKELNNNHARYYTGHNAYDSVWPNHSCKEDNISLYVFDAELIHYKEALDQSEPFVFPISLRYFVGGLTTDSIIIDKQLTEFDWIPKDILTACRTGRCSLFFEDPFEGYPEWNGSQCGYFVLLAERLQIPLNSIIVSTGNAKLPEIAREYFPGLAVAHEDWFRTEFWDRKLQFWPRLQHRLEDKDKLFLCYNRHWNHNRQYFVHDLWRSNLIKLGLVSLAAPTPEERIQIKNPMAWSNWSHNMVDMLTRADGVDEFLDTLPLLIDVDLKENMAHHITLEHYASTYLSVVTETWAFNTTAFFTEKIYKSIMAEHPFVVLSGQHYLKYLRQQGFKTYSPYINEAYDEEENEFKRAQMIIKELERISKLSPTALEEFYLGTKEIASYNRSVLETNPNYGSNILKLWNNKYHINKE